MSYCVALKLLDGMIFMSDTLTNGGLDNISQYPKTFSWGIEGERQIFLATAGNLATSQAVISTLSEQAKTKGKRSQSILQASTMFQVARTISQTLAQIIDVTAKGQQMGERAFSATFIHRQTTTNCIRFSTIELSNMASNILNAQERTEEIEQNILRQLKDSIIIKSRELNSAAIALSEIDFYSSLSFQSISAEWNKPIVDNSKTFNITAGRHPVIELVLRNNGSDNFVSNDCNLSPNCKSMMLLTGPNMAGKSTYLRQNALITILAQIGSYVPAKDAHIGVVDQIFSRVGASDDLSKGNSTFMVEMIETASILKNATDSTLIIMDEIGRGTSTYDGLSIAWASLEYIHSEIKCRTLFATHYHELTKLQNELPNIKNATIAIREWNEEVIFLHQVKFGTANKSYGIQVAKLAGLPNTVTNRATAILKALEHDRDNSDMSYFSVNTREKSSKSENNEAHEIFDMLLALNTDEITPKQALIMLDETINRIKELIKL